MSRIGKLPVGIPKGVTITVAAGNAVHVKGPGGELSAKIPSEMIIEINDEDKQLVVKRPSDQKEHRAKHGLSRSLINNMVVGVTQGYVKNLDIIGVGYRAQMQGKKLVLSVGYSHPVEIEAPKGVIFEVPTPNRIIIKGIDKQLVGQIAANLREIRPPEPYKGKGIKYDKETIRRKEGKTGK